MRVLAIETSCDESAVCLIEADGSFRPDFNFRVLGNALASQASLHAQYGGVFPNVAKREHAKALVPLLTECLRQANELQSGSIIYDRELDALLEREPELLAALKDFFSNHAAPDIDCIAVTHGPGLEPALWVGINFAKALASAWGVPLVAVNHMEGHIVIAMICDDGGMEGWRGGGMEKSLSLVPCPFPLLSLLISGGHTELVLSNEFGTYKRIGETRDDAAGEAFDKVARLLGLPYPGGPEISRLAEEARESGVVADFKFTRPMLHSGDYDFSFSGLKTEVRKLVEKNSEGPTFSSPEGRSFRMRVAREFEDTVADVLVAKTLRAVEEYGAYTVVVGGGVSANSHIREELARKLQTANCQLLVPPPELATDNALMIALAGYFHALNKEFADPATLRATGNLRLESTP
jgi:N6-L-threonylcarbamoyladenine synthase